MASSTYTNTLRVYQSNPNAYFRPVEKTVWGYANGGTWTEATGGEYVLTMGAVELAVPFASRPTLASRFSFLLGFTTTRGGDLLSRTSRATRLAPPFRPSTTTTVAGDSQREKQLSSYNGTSAAGRKVSIQYTAASGKDLKANIVFQ